MPSLGVDPYCRGKLLPLENELTASMKFKKKRLQIYEQILKVKKSNFLENAWTDLGD